MAKRKTRADVANEKRRRRIDGAQLKDYNQQWEIRFKAKLKKLRGITPDEWKEAIEGDQGLEEIDFSIHDLARDWETPVAEAADVAKLVHLAMRMDAYDIEEIRADLLKASRLAYEDELTIQAARVGCAGRVGRLNNGAILSEINRSCVEDAFSIANTYNYDLINEISRIRAATPTANRYTYAAKLRDWAAARAEWKNAQIMQYAVNRSRSKAQTDFYQINTAFGFAVLRPTKAVCPICQGWIRRGQVPIRVATNNPPPYHLNCPHVWSMYPDKVSSEECPNLWMGE